MDKQGFSVQFLAAVTDFSLPQSIQTSSGPTQSSYYQSQSEQQMLLTTDAQLAPR
jgi:hypothetical protein